MKKLVSLVLAMIMILCMASAFAAMEGDLTGGSITINDAIEDQTYNAYQILYLESYDTTTDPDNRHFVYKANSAWASWLATQTDYVAIDAQGYVTWVKDADAAEFAAAAQAQLSGKTADQSAKAEGTSVTLSDLKLGYYLLDTTLGTLCSLDTTEPNVVMQEKNEAPTVTKEVQEDANDLWGETNDADIGQTVNFKTTITVKAGAENYILRDSMSEGLIWNEDVVVTVGGTAVSGYKIDTDQEEYTFVVKFDNAYIATLAPNTEIVVTYSAKVSENAVIAGSGNLNEVDLQYGDANDLSTTPPDTTITYTWDMDVLKYGDGDKENPLEGVEFALLNSNKTKAAVVVSGKITSWADVPAEGAEWPANTVLSTNAEGKLPIAGLDEDVYYLHEIATLPGYNKLAEDVQISVKAGNVVDGEMVYTTPVAEINNQSGTELPSTGGIGTTIFYIVGGVLVLAAIVLLITKKRMNSAD